MQNKTPHARKAGLCTMPALSIVAGFGGVWMLSTIGAWRLAVHG